MRFLKYYTPLMFKLLGTQIIISLLSNMLYGTLYDFPVLLIIGTVMALGIYFYMQYRAVWEHACKETMKHPDLQMHIGPVTGLLVGLGSGIPAFIINLIPTLLPMHVTELGELSGGISQLCYSVGKFFFNGQYVAIIHSFFPLQVFDVQNEVLAAQNGANIVASVPYYLFTILPVALISWFAYWLGLKDKTLAAFFHMEHLFTNKKKEKATPPTLKK